MKDLEKYLPIFYILLFIVVFIAVKKGLENIFTLGDKTQSNKDFLPFKNYFNPSFISDYRTKNGDVKYYDMVNRNGISPTKYADMLNQIKGNRGYDFFGLNLHPFTTNVQGDIDKITSQFQRINSKWELAYFAQYFRTATSTDLWAFLNAFLRQTDLEVILSFLKNLPETL